MMVFRAIRHSTIKNRYTFWSDCSASSRTWGNCILICSWCKPDGLTPRSIYSVTSHCCIWWKTRYDIRSYRSSGRCDDISSCELLSRVSLCYTDTHVSPTNCFTKSLPSGLVAIVIVTLIALFVPGFEEVRNVSSYLTENWYANLVWSFPMFHIPVIEVWFLEMMRIITPYALILAIIGLTESLMTLSLIDEITETRGNNNKESIGQGIANGVCGFFGAMGWCAMIGQSMINISNGGRGRLSWISASVFLIVLIVFATSYISLIPLAALVWLMFMVVIGTFAWPTFKMLPKIPRSDAFVIIAVTVITVVSWDLALAVVAGVIISALVFAWKKAEDISVNRFIDDKKITHYELHWPLFFGSIEKFKTLFHIQEDTNEIIIDFADSHVMDHSAIEAINSLTEKYQKSGKTLHLKHLSPDCRTKIKNAEAIVDINVIEDPKYFVADVNLGK